MAKVKSSSGRRSGGLSICGRALLVSFFLQQDEIAESLAQAPSAIPDLHPNIADIDRRGLPVEKIPPGNEPGFSARISSVDARTIIGT